MPLTNMKRPPPAAKTEAECAHPCGPQEDYPYGLRIHLDTEQLEQLSIKDLPDVGTEVTLVAKAKVVDVHQGASERDKKTRRHVGLQITDLGFTPAKGAKKTEDVFYSDAKKGEA